MKDLGSLNYFLGIEIHRTSADLSLTQSKNIFDGDLLSDPTEYRSIVEALQ